jgi:hypothetical protein
MFGTMAGCLTRWTRQLLLLSTGVLLHHGRAKTATQTVENIDNLKAEVFQHSPYLGSSDFHFFIPMKKALRNRKFCDEDDVQ